MPALEKAGKLVGIIRRHDCGVFAIMHFSEKAAARDARHTPGSRDPLSLAEYRLREHRVDAFRHVDGLSDVQICGE